LFGERVTTQFMSQAMGWADNIILAMGPLGIVTIVVSAIRVGGPIWLRAIVGRARENRAAAEEELMSSTSDEVSELWNGQKVVRVAGKASIAEFICLLPLCAGAGTNPGAEEVAMVRHLLINSRPESSQASDRHGTTRLITSGYLMIARLLIISNRTMIPLRLLV
jgi:hypothetical protein